MEEWIGYKTHNHLELSGIPSAIMVRLIGASSTSQECCGVPAGDVNYN
jgi:hypothetical protein